jgi:hypothetical protein
LVKAKNADAIKPLGWMAQTDPDPELRALAEKAIRHLNGQTQTMPVVQVETGTLASAEEFRKLIQKPQAEPPQAPAPSRQTQEVEALRAVPDERGYYIKSISADEVVEGYEHYPYQDPDDPNYVPRKDWEQARTMAAAAYTDYVAGHPVPGIQKLADALDLDPLVRDEAAMQRATEALMPMRYQEAIALLSDKSRRDLYIRRRGIERFGVRIFSSWAHVATELGIFFVGQAIGLTALFSIWNAEATALNRSLQANRDYMFEFRRNNDLAAGYTTAYNYLSQIPNVVLDSLIMAAVLTTVFLLAAAVAHLTAKFALEGDGMFRETIDNLTQYPARVLPVVYLVGALGLYLLYPNNLADVDFGWYTLGLQVMALLLIAPFFMILGWQRRITVKLHALPNPMALLVVTLWLLVIGAVVGLIYLTVPTLAL